MGIGGARGGCRSMAGAYIHEKYEPKEIRRGKHEETENVPINVSYDPGCCHVHAEYRDHDAR